MALTLQEYRVVVNVVDNGNQTSTLTYYTTAVDMTEAEADTVTILAALEDMTDCVVSGYHVGPYYREDNLVLPGPGVQIQNKASITVNLAGTAGKANIKIPGPKIDIFSGTSGRAADIVDANDAAVLAYVGLFEAAGVATISDGELVSTANPIDGGKRIHSKSNRG